MAPFTGRQRCSLLSAGYATENLFHIQIIIAPLVSILGFSGVSLSRLVRPLPAFHVPVLPFCFWYAGGLIYALSAGAESSVFPQREA